MEMRILLVGESGGGRFFFGDLVPDEVGEVHNQLCAAHQPYVRRACEMFRNGDSVLDFVDLSELDFFEENRGSFHKLPGLADGHSGFGVQPQIAFKQSDALLLRRELE